MRWWNVKHPNAYAGRLAAGVSPAAGRETLTAEQRYDERVLLGVRLVEGLPLAELRDEGRQAVAGLIADGLLEGTAAVRALRGGAHPPGPAAGRHRRAPAPGPALSAYFTQSGVSG